MTSKRAIEDWGSSRGHAAEILSAAFAEALSTL
jgi:uncharacterized protein YkwD